MAEEQTHLSDLVDEIVRAGEVDDHWSSPADERASLHSLAAHDPQSIRLGLSHLWAAHIEYPNVFPSAAPAVRYVLALLDLRLGGDTVIRSPHGTLRPLRGHLLTWLSVVADAVGDVSERRFVDLAVHRQRVAAAARAFLDACTDPTRRRWAAEAFHELSPTYVAEGPVPDRMH